MKRMKSGVQALFVVALAGTLAVSALACPLWMASLSQLDMPCSKQDSGPEKCPVTICLASSSYLTTDASADTLLKQLPGEAVGADVLGTLLRSAEPIQAHDDPPPGPSGPLFLRTHSLLI